MAGSIAEPQASVTQSAPDKLALSGDWTAFGLAGMEQRLDALPVEKSATAVILDGKDIAALDTAGVWVLQTLIRRLRDGGANPELAGWQPRFLKLLELANTPAPAEPARKPRFAKLEALGRRTVEGLEQVYAGFSFVGEIALTVVRCLASPARLRIRPILYNIQSTGASALPIVGLLAFMVGIVVAYQGADQLRQYGANIFVADLIGLSMVREFAPLMTAIIVAGRSGSAFAAQIGAMQTTEEIDAMRTLGISPQEMLVLPKLFALVIALPLLTVFADVLGILGGMVMANVKLGVGFTEFLDRLAKAVSISSYVIGIGKAPVFAAIIVMTGCFQGFRTKGGADSVGRQTTRSVVQAIFLVIVTDALFSVLFSVLDL
jgi:phospholipid/cholesterol/gamma-HCH transport system permease protein